MRDNISDMLARIKNGQQAKLFEINLFSPVPKVCLQILNLLYKEGYIRGFKKVYINKKLHIKVLLKYDLEGNPVIKKISRVSKPGRRIYTSIKSV
jgi:small subunit ribosomal protein S8